MTGLMNRSKLVQRAVALSAVVTAGQLLAASGTWLATPAADTSWATAGNWQSGTIAGNNSNGVTLNDDVATFNSAANLIVTPDAGRTLRQLAFNSSAGAYVIGATDGNALMLVSTTTASSTIQLASAATVTINSPLVLTKNTNQQVSNASGTLKFYGDISTPATSVNFSMQSSVGTTYFYGSMSGAGRYYANSGSGGGKTYLMHSNSNTGGLMMDQDKGTYYLSAAGAITSAPINAQRGGNFVADATNAIMGTASVTVNDSTATYPASIIFNYGNDYTGATTIGTFGNQTGTGAKMWANNASGSATGSGDVVIGNGLLGGNGYIVNSGAGKGVTLSRRVDGSSNVTYAKLSPGASAGTVGTLTMNLGAKGLNISSTVTDSNTGSMLFDLNTIASSDKVSLLGTTVLTIGSGLLNFDDFVFTAGAGLQNGVYTLFDSSSAISGTLGANLTGAVGTNGATGTLSTADSGHDIILTVVGVPEPSMVGLLGLVTMGLIGRRLARH